MRAHKPTLHINDRTKELVGKIGAAVSLLEIDLICGEDACKVGSTRVMRKVGSSKADVAKNLPAWWQGSQGNRFCLGGMGCRLTVSKRL
jgi:hypothetical protein